MTIKKVALIMGGSDDLPVVRKAVKVLESFGVPYEMRIMSAYRTPVVTANFSEMAAEDEVGVIIAASGRAAHLAGAVAAHTVLPVIGLPLKSTTLDELGALLSTVQMPRGVPVATVGIDAAENAAYLAVQILAVYDYELHKKLLDSKKKMEEYVLAKDLELDLGNI